MSANIVRMVIGSWGSYNACNERALGSKWLDFDNYDDWEEIEEELEREGFKLNGIDAELFVQDIEGVPDGTNWDYVHPQRIFELIKKSGILDDKYKYEVMEAFCEVRSFREWEELVDCNEESWNDDIYLYRGYSWADYGREIFENACYDLPDNLEDYIDFEQYGEDKGNDYAYRYSHGIIEIIE